MRLNKPHMFDDGSSIEWVDRETVRYTSGDFSALIWVDIAPGFFSRSRIIKTSSIRDWQRSPQDVPRQIDDQTRQRIVEKVVEYYQAHGTRVAIEE